METLTDVKKIVKEKYAEIAVASERKSCCGNSKIVDYTIMKDDYTHLDGYVKEADLGLGCGLPTEIADIKPGDTVVDLGAGAGNDIFVARSIAGENGKLIGIDFTQEMIDKANRNKEKLQYENVEFKLGDIENLPIENNLADVVISNCVLNLVPDKQKAFAEIFRVIKPGGHFCVSDIVIKGKIDDELRKSAELYAGCVSGAVEQSEYLNIIRESGFEDVQIKKTKAIILPDSLLKKFLDDTSIEKVKQNLEGIFSITVSGTKK